jgi:hypothetical protein
MWNSGISSWLKKLPDGRWVFYPWGQFMRGYIITSDKEVARLRMLIYLWLGLAFSSTIAVRGIFIFIIMAFWFAVYFVWMAFRLRTLQRYEGDLSAKKDHSD